MINITENKLRVFIVDPSDVWRKILKNIIASAEDMTLAGEVASNQAALLMLDGVDPDIVLLASGVQDEIELTDVISHLRQIRPGLKILLCVDSACKEKSISAMDSGVFEFITRPYKDIHVLRGIRECYKNVRK